MCGRFSATFTFREIRLRWKVDGDNESPLFGRRFNIAPSQDVAVIVSENATRDLKQMQWGLVPSWAKDPAIGNQMINARAETLTSRASFKDLVDTRRCLILCHRLIGRKTELLHVIKTPDRPPVVWRCRAVSQCLVIHWRLYYWFLASMSSSNALWRYNLVRR